MAQYNANLFSMASQVQSYKSNSSRTQIEKDINARVRALLDWRPFWSALLTRAVISIPNAYTTGGVTLTTNSKSVTGTGTAWPVNDVVNTTVPGGLRGIGFQELTPASMDGISVDRNLYIDDGVFSETVAVVQTTNSTFTAQYQFQHNAGFTLTSSSLAGLQLLTGSQTPVYTLLAVTSTTGGLIDMPFGGATMTDAGYSLVKAYVTIDPDLKDIWQVWDTVQGIPLAFHESQAFLAQADPQRTATGNPQCLVDLSPSAAGSMQFELWPYQTSSYQIPLIYMKQWPEMKKPTDRPPHFINPSVIIDGAIADALRRKDLRSNDDKDPYYDPQLAQQYEQKFLLGAQQAANADESKSLHALTQTFPGYSGVSAAYQQSHIGPWDNSGGWGGGY